MIGTMLWGPGKVRRFRGRRAPATRTPARALVAAMVLVGCSEASLDEPSLASVTTGTDTDGLPPIDTAPVSDSATETAGDSEGGDDPALCEPGCRIGLPLGWVYQGLPDVVPAEPGTHQIPAMILETDGTLTVLEQRQQTASIHHLDADGDLAWNIPVPLPCDLCEVASMSRHPSGDLLLSATGWLIDGEFSLIASRYDTDRHATVWLATQPLPDQPELPEFSTQAGAIVGMADSTVVQLYVRHTFDFQAFQNNRLIVYDPDGLFVEDEELTPFDDALAVQPPLLAQATPSGELAVGLVRGSSSSPFGQTDRIHSPHWEISTSLFSIEPLDALLVDERDHSFELFHGFDGKMVYLVLNDRAGTELQPRWVATLALPSDDSSRAALALGPDGDVYAAIRTTPGVAGNPGSTVGVSLVRWTTEGELRWHSTVLMNAAQTDAPVSLAVDDDDGLVIAAVVDDRLRVERRAQRCVCE